MSFFRLMAAATLASGTASAAQLSAFIEPERGVNIIAVANGRIDLRHDRGRRDRGAGCLHQPQLGTQRRSSSPRHLVSIGADFAMDAASGHGGSWMSIRGNCFLPVGRALLLNLGVGRGWGSSKFTRAFYGVPDQDTGVFPSLVNQTYGPGKGWMDWRVNYGAIVHLSPSWHLVAGGRWQRLGSDLARSPAVAERGRRIQTILGLGVGYVWK